MISLSLFGINVFVSGFCPERSAYGLLPGVWLLTELASSVRRGLSAQREECVVTVTVLDHAAVSVQATLPSALLALA